jgi:protein gp37
MSSTTFHCASLKSIHNYYALSLKVQYLFMRCLLRPSNIDPARHAWAILKLLVQRQSCSVAHWHSFQLLTKNPSRLNNFSFSSNVWVGASSPPDFMRGLELSRKQQETFLFKTLQWLGRVEVPVTWMSIEPLSWDVSKIIEESPPLNWAVIGAATHGSKVYQPKPDHVFSLLDVFDQQNVPVFFKGNL